MDKVKQFWDEQAAEHGASDLATAPDHHYRELEIRSILRVLGKVKHDTVLDVGCGNGHTTMQIAKKFPDAEITGVDYSAPMIEEARKRDLSNVEFLEGNVLSLGSNSKLAGAYDVVVSTRCLINLATWEEQKAGISEMCDLVSPTGRLILVENLQDGLRTLNDLRHKLSLPPIATRWHNLYLDMTKLREFLYLRRMSMEYAENIGNMYYIASRVIYAKMCQDAGTEPQYDSPINAIAKLLPSLGDYYACSPNYLFVLRMSDT